MEWLIQDNCWQRLANHGKINEQTNLTRHQQNIIALNIPAQVRYSQDLLWESHIILRARLGAKMHSVPMFMCFRRYSDCNKNLRLSKDLKLNLFLEENWLCSKKHLLKIVKTRQLDYYLKQNLQCNVIQYHQRFYKKSHTHTQHN